MGVAVFRIPLSPNRPNYVKEGEKRQAFIRVADRSVKASREVWEVLKKSRTPKDTVFRYGLKEEVLMKALGEKSQITLVPAGPVCH